MRKGTLVVTFILMLSSISIFARNPSTRATDIINMVQAGVSDDTIREFALKSGKPLNLTADEVVALKHAGVSDTLTRDLLADSRARVERERAARPAYRRPAYPSRYYGYYDPFSYRSHLSFGFGHGYGGHGYGYGGHGYGGHR